MKNRIILLALFLIGMTGCKTPPLAEPFKTVKELKGQTFITGDRLMDPGGLGVINHILIVENNKATPLIELYDRETKELTASFLSIGEGPSEVLMGSIIQTKGDVFYVSDLFNPKLLECRLNEIRKEPTYIPQLVFSVKDIDDQYGGSAKKLLLGNDFIIATTNSLEGRVLLMNPEKDFYRYFITYPDKEKVDPRLNAIQNAGLYASSITLSPDGKRVALSTYEAGMIDLFEIKDQQVIPIWSHLDFYPNDIDIIPMGEKFVPAFTPKSRNGYIDNCSTNKYVYSLFSGKRIEEPNYYVTNRIRVVNWTGTETFEYHLDRNINYIAVSPDDRFIYGIGKNEKEENEIIVFDVKS